MNRFTVVTLWLLLAGFPALAGGLSDEQAYKYSEAVNEAARYGRSGNYKRAFEAYERALQYNAEASDVYFNLVAIADATKQFNKAFLYAKGYLAVAGEGSDDGREVLAKLNVARKQVMGVGKLSVTVEPVGAVVTVDGAYMGTAPFADLELPVGTYKVSAVQRDYHPGSADVKVHLGEAATVSLKLNEIVYTGTLTIATKPEAGVAVFVDDKYIGTTPLAEPLKVQANREHVVRFEAKGLDTWTRAVFVAPDKPATVEATLEAPTPNGPSNDQW